MSEATAAEAATAPWRWQRSARDWFAAHADLVSLLLIALAVVRVAATLTVFSATTDEGLHVSAGLQVLQERRYAFQLENPPLPRVVFALPLHLLGATFRSDIAPSEQMQQVFFTNGHYETSLVAARAGSIVFFIIAALATWRFARRELGLPGGAAATFFFTTQPMILGMAGIANLDMATVTGVALTLLAFSRWLETPSAARAAMAGFAFGVSIGLKFSNLLFAAAACLALALVHRPFDWRRALAAVPVALLAAFAGVWATYGFTLGEGFLPMPSFWRGIAQLIAMDRGATYLSYAFGRTTFDGWWWYFPAALVFKTTLATLISVCAGAFVGRGRAWLAGVACALAILIPAMPAKLDLGLRYVLPVYIPLSIAAAAAVLMMLGGGTRLRAVAFALIAWQGGASLLAHPDYFPYFNELAGREPGRLFVDSNLDWGQDMLRLRRVLREEKVERIVILAAGAHDYGKLGFPSTYQPNPWVPARGWVAVSEHFYQMFRLEGGFFWLKGQPYRRIGESIRLYHLP